jgi:glycosyltransferase involved in cell wall biosynthesis
MIDQLVTVIIAVRNGERYLRSAIESVLEQQYKSIEILLVDSHSTDQTTTIGRGYPHVQCLPQMNYGIADARNLGIASARGDFIAFLSHDDLWTSDKLSSQMEYMMRFPRVQYTVGRAKFFLEAGLLPPAGFRQELLVGDHEAYIPETLLARRSVFDEVGLFDVRLMTGEDVDWFARAKDKQVPHAVIAKVLLYKRVHNFNTSLNNLSNSQLLLRVMRRSIERKRAIASSETGKAV